MNDIEEDEGKEGYKAGGYHPVSVGEWYKHRYKVLKKLGWGHFSTVWLARDSENDTLVALKIVKSASHYTEAALDEIELLKKCSEQTKNKDSSHVVHLLDNFVHPGPHGQHVVMVFEVLGRNLLDLIEKHYYGLPIPIVKSITKQILLGCDFLHKNCKIIHTDLKPENVLLIEPLPEIDDVDSDDSEEEEDDEDDEVVEENENNENGVDQIVSKVKIADLGNACWTNKHFTDDIQTRQYRSPEAIVGYKYSTSADIWSVACIVFELATGDLLFKPKKGKNHAKSDDHLALMLELLNKSGLPKKLISQGKYSKNYFDKRGRIKAIPNLKPWPLVDVLTEKYNFSGQEAEEMSSFLIPMLRLDPERRVSAEEALQHEWLDDAETSINIPFEPDYEEDDDKNEDDILSDE
eukprot:TRINITY_DN1084_c0_g1_i1.p1 TRINITY_DN1084_c0_g1~~TRINITY_DN1084_c0_g1_i1.p1  ORF type:complete len:407 (-),score=150.58 TRINITY_DN1084_c0_g1_i1:51-1271(-)